MNTTIIPINYNNQRHLDVIIQLSKMNNFYEEEINADLYIIRELQKTTRIGYCDKGYFLLLNINGKSKAIGFIMIIDNNYVYTEIGFILIDKKYRDKGYGSILMNHTLKEIDQTKPVVVKTESIEILDWYIIKHQFQPIELDVCYNINISNMAKEYKNGFYLPKKFYDNHNRDNEGGLLPFPAPKELKLTYERCMKLLETYNIVKNLIKQI